MTRALVPLATGLALRNVLRTELHAEFVARGVEPVYLVPAPLLEQIRESGRDGALTFDVLPECRVSPLDKFLQSIAYAPVPGHHEMSTIRIRQRLRDRGYGRAPLKEKILFPLLGWTWGSMHALNAVRRVLFGFPELAPLFAQWEPDVVFSNNVFNPWESAVLVRAHKEGVRTVGMVHSWDNPSNKATFPGVVDRLLVWGATMRREMQEYFRIPSALITEVGTPQFDAYHRPPPHSREEVLAALGFEKNARLVVYGTGSPGHCSDEPGFARLLAELCTSPAPDGEDRPIRLLVRLHPRDHEERYEGVSALPGVALEVAGRGSTHMADRWNPTDDDHLHFLSLMRHADVVVNMASTLALDAAANDRPVVHVRFDPEEGREYLDSNERLFDYAHTARLMSVGASLVSRSAEELKANVLRSLAAPGELAEQRRALVAQEGADGGGESAARIAEIVAGG